MKLIVDTDPGHDDLVALALAAQVAEVSLITTVNGNAPLKETTLNALIAADLIGYEGPLVSGADRPRVREPSYPTQVHGSTGLDGAPRPPTSREPTGVEAARAIIEAADEDTWIVAIGPLTNVAEALDCDPGLASRIAGITIMGGAIAGGNMSAVAEFNIWTDPEAADVVFRSGARLIMCGLDLTRQVRYDEQWLDGLHQSYVAAVMRHYLENHGHLEAAGAPLHDPCAVLAVTHPQLFTFADYPVTVSCDEKLTRGMTVVDQRPWVTDANTTVALTIDAPAALELVASAINRLAS